MYCKNHSDREATGACAYCGNLFCEECLVEINGRNYCKEHVAKALGNNANSKQQYTSESSADSAKALKGNLSEIKDYGMKYVKDTTSLLKDDWNKDLKEIKKSKSKHPVINTICIIFEIILLLFIGYKLLSYFGVTGINYEKDFNASFNNKQEEKLFDDFYNNFAYGSNEEGYYTIPDMIKSIEDVYSKYNWEVENDTSCVILNLYGLNLSAEDITLTFMKDKEWDLYSIQTSTSTLTFTKDSLKANNENIYDILDGIYDNYIENVE